MKPIIAMTIGDFNGIGPEVSLKTAAHPSIRRVCSPVLIGPMNILEHTVKTLKLRARMSRATFPTMKGASIPVVDAGDGLWLDVKYGSVSKDAGKSAGKAIERAVDLCLRGDCHAIVTAPASKEALYRAGYNFPGQTEMIALLSRSQRVAMMLVSERMRVGLVTIHVSVKDIAGQITKDRIVEKTTIVHETLVRHFQEKHPRIALLALNPHAGEHGTIGKEEEEIILPAREELRQRHIDVDGPFPADSFFGKGLHKQFAAVMAMYHDQGLIPLKMSSFGKAVNFSAGLNIIRTSPDHGTAFDIAGKGKADASSMMEAVRFAAKLAAHSVRERRTREEAA